MQIVRLRCEYEETPLGIDVARPRLSWQLESDQRGARQTAYRVLVASSQDTLARDQADLWDSGRVQSNQSVHVEYDGTPLGSGQRAWWKVQAWDENDALIEYSNASWWEASLPPEEWTAQWIGGDLVGSKRTSVPLPYLRTAFALDKPVQSARLYATAMGLYECELNGQRVGDDVFRPGWTEYSKRLQFQTYDVTSLLQQGENAWGAVLGDGWACGYVGWKGRQRYGDRPQFCGQMVVTFEDGTTQTIQTDASWKHAYGALLEADLMAGESYDARLEMPDWSRASFDDARWQTVRIFDKPKAKLVAQVGPSVTRHEELAPIDDPTPLHAGSKDAIFDLGQNMVGVVRLKVRGKRGQMLRLRFAETLENGQLYVKNLRGARATDYYTCGSDEEETWEPRFTFHGFRYVEVTGLTEAPTRDMISGIVLQSQTPPTGSWESSNALLNQLQHNIQWGQKGNFLEVPTDCPQRDERLGWTGDAQVFIRTAAFNADVARFFEKWQDDIADAQLEDGAVPCVVPTLDVTEGDGGPAWSDAAVICPWTIYGCYADHRVLERHYDQLAHYVAHLEERSRAFGLIRSHPDAPGFPGFGDWLAVDGSNKTEGGTPKDLIGTAFLAHDAHLMSKIAGVLGKNDDVAKYDALREEVKTVFQRRYITPDGLMSGASQTAYVLALHFDLMPQEMRSVAARELVRDIKARGGHLSTGFVGSPYIPHVLSSNGYEEEAFKLLMQTSWPSWLYAVTQGATTIWERWDGWTHDKGFQDAGMNSFNHYAYGAIGDWLYSFVAGIDLDWTQPGYKHFVLRPHPGADLTHVRAKLDSVHGTIESGWKIDNDEFVWDITIPPNTSATVHLPTSDANRVLESGRAIGEAQGIERDESQDGAVFQVQSGRYSFRAPMMPQATPSK